MEIRMGKESISEKIQNLIMLAIDTIPNFIIIDKQSRVTYINESYCELLGVRQTDALGRPVAEVVPGTKLTEIVETGRMDLGAIMTFYHHKTQKSITLACSRVPLTENGQIVGAVGLTTLNDMTELPKLLEEVTRLQKKNRQYKQELARLTRRDAPLGKIIGSSPAIESVKNTIRDYANSSLTILITGETGVGKEVFATAVHEMSPRKKEPFIRINCAAIPHDLLESELFGYEDGAFTGARAKGKKGLIEAANHGTLLLDEIGEMSMDLQSKLLRVLQEQEIERIGGTKPIKIDVRLVCSTNRNILDLIREKKFRADLYYRINTVEIEIPPLRERKGDIAGLCEHFIRQINLDSEIHTRGISEEVLHLFHSYDWPGNVRELKHVVERLAFINPESMITIEDCDFFRKRIADAHSDRQPSVQAVTGSASLALSSDTDSDTDNHSVLRHTEALPGSAHSIRKLKEQTEINAILAALTESGGNKAKASRILGIDRSLLYYKLKKYHLE
jgi:PAS domain S-box-containing protein